MRSTWSEDKEKEQQEDQLLNSIDIFDVEEEQIEKTYIKE